MIEKRDNKGFTLLEIAICIVIIGIIAAAAAPNMLSMFEDADAEMLRALGAEVEVALAQGVNRGKTYTELTTNGAGYLDDIISYAETTQDGNVTITYTGPGAFTANLVGASGRTASYSISTNANVNVTAITGFNNYSVVSGDIVKN